MLSKSNAYLVARVRQQELAHGGELLLLGDGRLVEVPIGGGRCLMCLLGWSSIFQGGAEVSCHDRAPTRQQTRTPKASINFLPEGRQHKPTHPQTTAHRARPRSRTRAAPSSPPRRGWTPRRQRRRCRAATCSARGGRSVAGGGARGGAG